MGNGSSSMSTSDMSSSGPLSPSTGSYASTFSGHADMRAPMASNPTDYSCYSTTISTSESNIRAEMKPKETGNPLAEREITQDDSWASYTPCDIYDKIIAPVFFGKSNDILSSTTNNFDCANERHTGFSDISTEREGIQDRFHQPSKTETKAPDKSQPERETKVQNKGHSEREKSDISSYERDHPVSAAWGREMDPNRDNAQRAKEAAETGVHLVTAAGALSTGTPTGTGIAIYETMEAARTAAPIVEEVVCETGDAYVKERTKAVEGGYSENSEMGHQ